MLCTFLLRFIFLREIADLQVLPQQLISCGLAKNLSKIIGLVESWVMNGLAVVATFEGNYPRAEQRYNEALALVSYPLITANLTQMLVETGRLSSTRSILRGTVRWGWDSR